MIRLDEQTTLRDALRVHECPTPRMPSREAAILADLATILGNREQPSLYFAMAHGVEGSLEACVRDAWARCEDGHAMGKLAEALRILTPDGFSMMRLNDDGGHVSALHVELDSAIVSVTGLLPDVAKVLRRLIPLDEVWRLWDPERRFMDQPVTP